MLTLGSLCTGYGGLDRATEAVLGTTTAWLSEIDPAAGLVCEVRFPGVRNLGDLTVLDWSKVPPVDVLTAGYPCQPFSHAGKREGTSDARHLWPFIADALRVLRPRLAIFENVAGHLSLGFDVVLADLARLGFDAEWIVVRASDVGACHRRARLFVAAIDATAGRPTVADADAHRLTQRPEHDRAEEGKEGHHLIGVDADGRVLWGNYGNPIRRHERLVGRPHPHPVDHTGRLSARFVEWMMCLPDGWVTSVLPSRTQALEVLGNGVVPPQAELAVRVLLARMNERIAA